MTTIGGAPSLVTLDACEADVIAAARAVAALPTPPVRLDDEQHMAEDDALADAMQKLRDALVRLYEAGGAL